MFVKVYDKSIPYNEIIADYLKFNNQFAHLYRVLTINKEELKTITSPVYDKELVKIGKEYQYRNFIVLECLEGEAVFSFPNQDLEVKISAGQTIVYPATFMFTYTIVSKNCIIDNVGIFLNKEQFIIESRSN